MVPSLMMTGQTDCWVQHCSIVIELTALDLVSWLRRSTQSASPLDLAGWWAVTQWVSWQLTHVSLLVGLCCSTVAGLYESHFMFTWHLHTGNIIIYSIKLLTASIHMTLSTNVKLPVMLSPRGQAVLEAKILSSASKICPWPRTRAFVLGLSSNFLCWPRVLHYV